MIVELFIIMPLNYIDKGCVTLIYIEYRSTEK
jgi:hypothetical protein